MGGDVSKMFGATRLSRREAMNEIREKVTSSVKLVVNIQNLQVQRISPKQQVELTDGIIQDGAVMFSKFSKSGQIERAVLDGIIGTLTDINLTTRIKELLTSQEGLASEPQVEAVAVMVESKMTKDEAISKIKSAVDSDFVNQIAMLNLGDGNFVPQREKEMALSGVLDGLEAALSESEFVEQSELKTMIAIYSGRVASAIERIPAVVKLQETNNRDEVRSVSAKGSVFPAMSPIAEELKEGSSSTEPSTTASSVEKASRPPENMETFITNNLSHVLTNKRKVMLRSIQAALKTDPDNAQRYKDLWVTVLINAFQLNEQGAIVCDAEGKILFQEHTMPRFYADIVAEMPEALVVQLEKGRFSDPRRIDTFDSKQQDYPTQIGRWKSLRSYLLRGDFVKVDSDGSSVRVVTGVYNNFAGDKRLESIFNQTLLGGASRAESTKSSAAAASEDDELESVKSADARRVSSLSREGRQCLSYGESTSSNGGALLSRSRSRSTSNSRSGSPALFDQSETKSGLPTPPASGRSAGGVFAGSTQPQPPVASQDNSVDGGSVSPQAALSGTGL